MHHRHPETCFYQDEARELASGIAIPGITPSTEYRSTSPLLILFSTEIYTSNTLSIFNKPSSLGYKIVSFQEYPEMGWIFMSLKRNSKANVFHLKSPKHGSIRQHNAYIKW
uniref:Uncharacterized protein n=1 Tax=Populus trichocarpa TaxID=3694 RepID=A0A2K1Y6L6_POPTR